MSNNNIKSMVAESAMNRILPDLHQDMVIGIGTGTTVDFFIDMLAEYQNDFDGCVASSEQSAQRLKSHGIAVYDLNNYTSLDFYIDGADEFNSRLQLIKGGGAALTREKIVASVAKQFICIADISKKVDILGQFPLPIEVIPMARSYVAREIVRIGGDPAYRQGVVTDNGNVILDIWNMDLSDPITVEQSINQITGVVSNGLFATRTADIVLCADENKIQLLQN